MLTASLLIPDNTSEIGNAIVDSAATQIAKALKVNTTLTMLDLNGE